MKKISILIVTICVLILSCAKTFDTNMTFIEGGTFIMGSPNEEYDRDHDERTREVTVSSFYIGIYEVTQREYRNVMRKNPSKFRGANLPVDTVSWYEALEYCNKLSRREGLTPAYNISDGTVTWDRRANGYRLPTEAEWEYAARANTTTPFFTGENITTDQANYDGNYPYADFERGVFRETTIAVGSFAPNPFGLYDMSGNVYEWCYDWHGYYDTQDIVNPIGPATGTNRVIRGGSWINGGYVQRSSYRGIYTPAGGNERIGFRLARNAQ